MGSRTLKWVIRHRAPALILIDLIAFQLAFLVTYALRFESGIFRNPIKSEFLGPAAALTLYWLILYVLRGIYTRKISTSRYEAFLEVFKTLFVGILIMFIALMDPSRPVSPTRVILLTYGFLLLLFSGGGHAFFRTFIRHLYVRRIGLFRSLIVGFGQRGQNLHNTLAKRPLYGHQVAGVVRADDSEPEPDGTPSYALNDLSTLLANPNGDGPIEYVLVTMEPNQRDSVLEVIDTAHRHGTRVMIMPDFFQILVGLAKSRELYGVPLLEVFPDLMHPAAKVVKRLMDIVVALIVLTLGLPLMFLIAVAIKIDSRGPILYKQKRVGYRGREFTLFKFRSMFSDAEKHTGAVWATEGDPRVTRIGKFLRSTRLDELPQAWNVLRGTMSLVGPRPERRIFVEQFAREIPFYSRRLNVKPGITGWAQVRRGYDTSIDDVRDKLQYDLFYLENISIGLDIKILLNTLWVMITAKGH